MARKTQAKTESSTKYFLILLLVVVLLTGIFWWLNSTNLFSSHYQYKVSQIKEVVENKIIPPPVLDKEAYDQKLTEMANFPVILVATTTATSTASTTPPTPNLWPVKTVYPNYGAILPFKRVVAYYGNFYSTKMGALGEYEPVEMLRRLKQEVTNWETADPTTPVMPAIHYIAITAQASAGEDGKYRLRMPDSEIDKAIELAKKVDGIVFLDLQVALSNLQTEIPLLEKYFKMPQVHLGIDPEFSMKAGDRPGTVIGTFDAADINYAAEYLAKLVRDNNLPPKILVIHRFTKPMVTNYKLIKPLPEVQIVMHMDGWGTPAKKFGTYNQVIYPEPVQFTGFKLFYKNDLKSPSTHVLTPAELLTLKPRPVYIQYQ